MSDERDDGEAEESADDRTESEGHGFRFKAGLRSVSDVLGSLVEVNVGDVQDPSAETVEWEDVEEDESDREGDRDERRRSRDRERPRPSESKRREKERPRRERKKRTRPIDAGKVLTDTYREGDEFVVTADIYGVSRDDLSVGIDPRTNELVVGANDTALERVSLPWNPAEATSVRYNNGVLEVRLRPEAA